MRVSIELSPATRAKIARMEALVKRVPAALNRAARLGAEALASAISEKELSGQTLKVVTDTLRRSVQGRLISASAHEIVAAVGVTKGPATKYAAVHEFGAAGGSIRARGGGALAVPLPAALTASGKPRFPGGPREAKARYPDMFMLKRRGRPPLLVVPKRVAGRPRGKVSALILLFVLVKSVPAPPRHWLSGGARKHLVVFENVVRRDLEALLKEV